MQENLVGLTVINLWSMNCVLLLFDDDPIRMFYVYIGCIVLIGCFLFASMRTKLKKDIFNYYRKEGTSPILVNHHYIIYLMIYVLSHNIYIKHSDWIIVE
jgi:hypothetical protein